MKTYYIYYNRASNKFSPAEHVLVGTVTAKNKFDALDKAQAQDFSYVEVELSRFTRNYPFIVKCNYL